MSNEDLRTDIRELRADCKRLEEKIDAVRAALVAGQFALRDKMDEDFRATDAKNEQRYATLSAAQTALRDKMDRRFREFNAEIELVKGERVVAASSP